MPGTGLHKDKLDSKLQLPCIGGVPQTKAADRETDIRKNVTSSFQRGNLQKQQVTDEQ